MSVYITELDLDIKNYTVSGKLSEFPQGYKLFYVDDFISFPPLEIEITNEVMNVASSTIFSFTIPQSFSETQIRLIIKDFSNSEIFNNYLDYGYRYSPSPNDFSTTFNITAFNFSNDTGYSDTDLNTKEAQQNLQLTFSEDLQSNKTLEISINNGQSWTDVTSSVNGASLSYPITLLSNTSANGESTIIKVRMGNGQGQYKDVASHSAILDTVSPTVTVSNIKQTTQDSLDPNDPLLINMITTYYLKADISISLNSYEDFYFSLDSGKSWTKANAGFFNQNTFSKSSSSSFDLTKVQFKIEDYAGNSTQIFSTSSNNSNPITATLKVLPDTGKSSTDNIMKPGSTFSMEVSLSRALTSNETISYSTDNGQNWVVGTSSVDSSNKLSITMSRTSDTKNTLKVKITENNMDKELINTDYIFDSIAPSQTITNIAKNGTNIEANISASLSLGDSNAVENLFISYDNGQTWTDVTSSVDSNNKLSTAIPSNVTPTNVQLKIEDIAGNASSVFDKSLINHITATLKILPDTGTSSTDLITKPSSPFSMEVDLSRALTSNETLSYSTDNGQNWIDVTSAVNSNNKLSINLSNISDASNTLKVKITENNIDKELISSKYIFDSTAPPQTITNIAKNGTNIEANVSASLSLGTSSAAEKLFISYDDGQTWADVTFSLDSNNKLSTAIPNNVTATNVKLKIEDIAGNTSSVFEKSLSSEITATLKFTPDTGISSTDNITKLGSTFSIEVNLSRALNSTETLSYSTDNGQNWVVGTSSVDSNNKLSINLFSNSDTSNTLKVKITENNIDKELISSKYVIDSTAPTQTITNITKNGTNIEANISSTLSLGNSDSAEKLLISYDNGQTWTDVTSSVDSNNKLSTAIPSNVTPTNVQLKIEDIAGNVSSSTSQIIASTLITVNNLQITGDSGVSHSDFITKTSSQTVNITGTLSESIASYQAGYVSFDNGVTWDNFTVNSNNIFSINKNLSQNTSNTIKFKIAENNTEKTIHTQKYTIDSTAPDYTFLNVSKSYDYINGTMTSKLSQNDSIKSDEKLFISYDKGANWTDLANNLTLDTTFTNFSTKVATNQTVGIVQLKVEDMAGNFLIREFDLTHTVVPPTITVPSGQPIKINSTTDTNNNIINSFIVTDSTSPSIINTNNNTSLVLGGNNTTGSVVVSNLPNGGTVTNNFTNNPQTTVIFSKNTSTIINLNNSNNNINNSATNTNNNVINQMLTSNKVNEYNGNGVADSVNRVTSIASGLGLNFKDTISSLGAGLGGSTGGSGLDLVTNAMKNVSTIISSLTNTTRIVNIVNPSSDIDKTPVTARYINTTNTISAVSSRDINIFQGQSTNSNKFNMLQDKNFKQYFENINITESEISLGNIETLELSGINNSLFITSNTDIVNIAGNGFVVALDKATMITGDNEAQTLFLGKDGGTINSGGGSDIIGSFSNSNDVFLSGDGNDLVVANLGNDYIEGGSGSDIIYADTRDVGNYSVSINNKNEIVLSHKSTDSNFSNTDSTSLTANLNGLTNSFDSRFEFIFKDTKKLQTMTSAYKILIKDLPNLNQLNELMVLNLTEKEMIDYTLNQIITKNSATDSQSIISSIIKDTVGESYMTNDIINACKEFVSQNNNDHSALLGLIFNLDTFKSTLKDSNGNTKLIKETEMNDIGWQSGGGNDIIKAGDGDDIIYTGTGNDIVLGGNGIDKVILQGVMSNFSFSMKSSLFTNTTSDTFFVTNNITNEQKAISGIEYLQVSGKDYLVADLIKPLIVGTKLSNEFEANSYNGLNMNPFDF